MRALLLEYAAKYRGRLGGGIALALLAVGLSVLPPYVLRQVVDDLAGSGGFGWPLHQYAAAIVLVALGEAGCRFGARFLVTGASRWVEYDLRNRYFGHLERLEPAYFQRIRTGDLVARATNDLSAVRQLFGPGLYHIVQTVLLLAASLTLMFQISQTLALWTALVVPTAMLLFVATRARIERRFTRVQEQFAALSDHAQETFAGQRVVKAYAQEVAEAATFRDVSQEYVRRQMAQIRLTGLLWPAMSLVVGLLVVMLLYVGGREVVEGRLTLGQFVQFNAYVAMLAWPMMALGWVATMIQQGGASLRRLHEVLATRPAIASPTRGQAPSPVRGEVELRDVSLVLGGRTVLDHVSLRIPPGATWALVGPLGSGKSSLANLIPRLLDPTSGEVLVDGVDVRDWPLEDLRRAIGYVPQETFLFSGSLRENVAFGLSDDEATESRVRDAVRLSQLEKDLDQWPAGLDTVIGERGVTLSGGQKQRAAIARAVAREPAILVLDDALSSVDTRTEDAILEGLRSFMAHRTSLVIAHRISTVRHADSIVVLERGRVVEQGTHAELVQHGGLYTQMYRRQLIAQELGIEESERPPVAWPESAPVPRARRGGGWEGG